MGKLQKHPDSERLQLVLKLASVIGQQFSLELLSELSPDTICDGLINDGDDAEDAGIRIGLSEEKESKEEEKKQEEENKEEEKKEQKKEQKEEVIFAIAAENRLSSKRRSSTSDLETVKQQNNKKDNDDTIPDHQVSSKTAAVRRLLQVLSDLG